MCLVAHVFPRLGRRGFLWSHVSISCKHFSLQRAPHAGVFEAAALFFNAHEVSLGPARDAPLHRILIHLGPRGVDSGFDLHFVLGVPCEALFQHFDDLGLPSRPDVVVERIEIWRICRESLWEASSLRHCTNFVSWRSCGWVPHPWCSGDAIFCGRHKNAAPRPHRPMWHQQQP